MSENETQPKVESTEERVTSEESAVTSETKKKSKVWGYVVAVVIVVAIILAVLYMMEKQGRSSTNIFESVIANQNANTVVAVVNGKEIINSDLSTSIQQFSQVASAQGVDITTPEATAEIRTQALDVLVNTELLKQAASEKGINISDEAVSERLEGIKTEIGGEEVLNERMTSLGITEDRLYKDVRDELTIQQLLETVFEEAAIEVTEEEVSALYQGAGGEEAGLPALEEVREQVEAQVRASKEQVAIDNYLTELKELAEIEIK